MNDGRVADIVSLALLGTCVAVDAYALATLPPRIATHFSGSQADGYGSKFMLLLMPLVSILTYAGFGLVKRVPVTQMNLMVRVTLENAARVRPVALAMLAWPRVSVMLVFALVELALVASAGGTLSPLMYLALAVVLFPIAIVAIFLPALQRAGGAPPSTGNS